MAKNNYFELIKVLTIRELKSRYKASFLGPIWIILQPLMIVLVISLVFGYFVKIPVGNIPYSLFVLSGLIIWNFFQQCINIAKDSLIWNRDLVTKTNIPREILPLSMIISKLPDFFIYFILLLVFMIVNKYQISLINLSVIVIIIPLFFLTSGIGLIFSLSNSIFRDFGRIYELFIMVYFYLTPVIYPESMILKNYKVMFYLNPLALMISFTRELIFYGKFNFGYFISGTGISIIIFLISIFIFSKFARKIADLI